MVMLHRVRVPQYYTDHKKTFGGRDTVAPSQIVGVSNMSDYGDNIKYKWTPESTTLLVSIWSDKQVQKQLEYAQRPQLIWESVARYMRKKGYGVSAKQCRSRMKQVLVCYREAKRAGTGGGGVEQYYDSIDRVLKNKKEEKSDINGIDTVDSAAIVKSPPKDVKTNKNLRMRFNKYSEPMETLTRTEVSSPTWHLAHHEEYPDSPESNETVLAQPYRTFSPTRDVATNTLNGRSAILTKGARRSLPIDRQPVREIRPIDTPPNNRFGEMLYQNAVQNVQNQIIQENMQQRNYLQNQFVQEEGTRLMQPEQLYRRSVVNPFYTTDDAAPSSKLRFGEQRMDVAMSNDPPVVENTMRMKNQLRSAGCPIDNRAMPQEPRRGNFTQNLAQNYKPYKEARVSTMDANLMETRRCTTNYSPQTVANLNEAFCHRDDKDERNDSMNDNYEQAMDNEALVRGMNATTMTNNATFNDDTISIEFLEGSQSPSDNDAAGSKSISGNSDRGVPNVPVRKKKVQKLEQLMLNAITSQSEVVNKILAAQDAMVSRFLDLDRDRQNRLENRLDHLMNVVHATVMNKSPDKVSERDVSPVPHEPLITNLSPPPRPGVVPPKLDLVPPKPCRVPCTSNNGNVEVVNQKTIQTRPGVISPIKHPGTIWSKLGPVSQSPFVKAQQQLGLRATAMTATGMNVEARTQSSAERRIIREMAGLDRRALVIETEKFLEIEKQMEEQSENARILGKMSQEVAAKRKLFASRREPNAGMILSAAFLDAERHFSSMNEEAPMRTRSASGIDEDEELMLLARQVENYERLRRLNVEQSRIPNGPPCDTSTPAKQSHNDKERESNRSPRQTIQQLADLVMKSARWRDGAAADAANVVPAGLNIPGRGTRLDRASGNNGANLNANNEALNRGGEQILRDKRESYVGEIAERESREKALGWLHDRYSYGIIGRPVTNDDRNLANVRSSGTSSDPVTTTINLKKPKPIGFTMDNPIVESNGNRQIPIFDNRIGFNPDILVANSYGRRNVAFADLEAPQDLIENPGQATLPRERRQLLDPQQQDYHQHFYYGNNRDRFSTLPLMHKNMINLYTQDVRGPLVRRQNDKAQQDSDEDDEFLDTTASMQPQSRKTSLTSIGGSAGKPANCVVS